MGRSPSSPSGLVTQARITLLAAEGPRTPRLRGGSSPDPPADACGSGLSADPSGALKFGDGAAIEIEKFQKFIE